MKIIRFLSLLAIVTMTVAYGITEQQTIAQWAKQYNDALTQKNYTGAMTALNKLQNRKTPASQAKFKDLWAQFNSMPDQEGFETPQQATDFYFAAGRLTDLQDQANDLITDMNNRLKTFTDAQQRVGNFDAIKRSGNKLTKDQESQRRSAQDDLNSSRRILGIRKEELRTVIEGKGDKKQQQNLGIEGFTARFESEMEKHEARLAKRNLHPTYDMAEAIQHEQNSLESYKESLQDFENQLRGGAVAAPVQEKEIEFEEFHGSAPAAKESAAEIQQKAVAAKAKIDQIVTGLKAPFEQLDATIKQLVNARIKAMSDKEKATVLANKHDDYVNNFMFNDQEKAALQPITDSLKNMTDVYRNMSDAVYNQLRTMMPGETAQTRQEQIDKASQTIPDIQKKYAATIVEVLAGHGGVGAGEEDEDPYAIHAGQGEIDQEAVREFTEQKKQDLANQKQLETLVEQRLAGMSEEQRKATLANKENFINTFTLNAQEKAWVDRTTSNVKKMLTLIESANASTFQTFKQLDTDNSLENTKEATVGDLHGIINNTLPGFNKIFARMVLQKIGE